MKKANILAFDMGASSGRAILGQFDGERLDLTELCRFANEPVHILGNLYWDVLWLLMNIRQGLTKYSAVFDQSLLSIGIDTWGSDYGILDREGHLLANPNHYRDTRINGIVEKLSGIISAEKIFNITGNIPVKYNTVYQLKSMCDNQSTFWDNIHTVLMMPDLLSYFLTGERASEYTNATTTQLMSLNRNGWNLELLKILNIPAGILTAIQQPGMNRGRLTQEIAMNTRVGDVPVTATATHDTASAIAAIPGLDEDSAFISSGTWSLIGTETGRLFVDKNVYRWGYSNEGGVEGRNLLLRNTVGMWIIQECIREWDKTGEIIDYNTLDCLVESSEAFLSLIDPDDERFSQPGDMPLKVREYCRDTRQRIPETKSQIARCIYESLAFKYRWCLEKLEKILERPLIKLHIVGGGAKNRLLNQFTSNAVKKPVICGPTEATAAGNIMVQSMALGEVANLKEIRQVVANSFNIQVFEPENIEQWDENYSLFLKLLDGKN